MGNCISSGQKPPAPLHREASVSAPGAEGAVPAEPRRRGGRSLSADAGPAPHLAPLTDAQKTAARPVRDAFFGLVAASAMVKSEKFAGVRNHFKGLAARPAPAVLKALSQHNLALLRSELQRVDTTGGVGRQRPLEANEREFMAALTQANWHMTHATPVSLKRPGQDAVTLASHWNLQTTARQFGPTARPANQTANDKDVDQLGNGHYVFFALEVGETPMKNRSRFGDIMYRTPFDPASLGDHAMMMLNDPLAPNISLTESYLGGSFDVPNMKKSVGHKDYWNSSGLGQETGAGAPPRERTARYPQMDRPLFSRGAVDMSLRPDGVTDRFFFQASSALEAIGMAVVVSARKLDDDALRNELLKPDEANLNRVVNSLFRPQIMVPHQVKLASASEIDLQALRC